MTWQVIQTKEQAVFVGIFPAHFCGFRTERFSVATPMYNGDLIFVLIPLFVKIRRTYSCFKRRQKRFWPKSMRKKKLNEYKETKTSPGEGGVNHVPRYSNRNTNIGLVKQYFL